MITAIIPLRLSPQPIYDEIERLSRIFLSIPKSEYNILVVDFGTIDERVPELRSLAKRYRHVTILRTGSPEEPFSIGAARDYGVRHAKTPVIMFHDLDFLCETETYLDIAAEVKLRALESKGHDFICIPTIYLTEAGTVRYLAQHNSSGRRDADRFVHNNALRDNKNEFIQHFSLGSSALVINRYFYLMSGGHDPAFTGHGAEDFEFYNRLTDFARRQGRPPNFENDIPVANGVWEGYRSFFAIYGVDIWMRGIALVHLCHPRREDTDPSYKKSSVNFNFLKQKLTDFKKVKKHLTPLKDPHLNCRSLILVNPTSMPAQSLRGALPALGDFRFIPETSFDSPELLCSYVENEGIDHLLFLNPYGNPHRLSLFEEAKARGHNAYAFDRGALPDSWFFDDGGFLGRSSKYHASNWDVDVSVEALGDTRRWFSEFISAGKTLEHNGSRKTGAYWRDALGVGDRKIVLVALQRPNDTATKYFAGPADTYSNYLEWLQQLSHSLDRRYYALVVKKHPLEASRPQLDQAIFVPDDANIHDLIDASECVVVLNSGVGVLSLAMNKPVIVCGLAYYANGNLAYQATSAEHLHELVHQELRPAGDGSVKFIRYLRDVFYSFGVSGYFEKKEIDGSVTRICNRIDFAQIRNLPGADITLGSVPPWVSPGSFLMRGARGFRDPLAKPTPAPAKLAPAPAKPPPAPAKLAPAPAKPTTPQPNKAAASATTDITPQLSLSALAQRTNQGTIEVGVGAAGHAVFGPYSEISPGNYQLRVQAMKGASVRRLFAKGGKFVFDVAVEGGEQILTTKSISTDSVSDAEYEETLSFLIPEGGSVSSRKFEFRLWTDGNVKLNLTRVTLSQKA